ncbi:MAG: hypothetical protein V5A14_06500, partial [Desulfohalobiaceae bacterium]
LHHLFEFQLVHDLALSVTEHAATVSRMQMVSMSIISLLIGAVPAYLLYFSQKWDPRKIYDRSSLLRGIHTFLWQRWYINSFYEWFFVRGTQRLASFVADRIEEIVDPALNRGVPAVVLGLSRFSDWFDRRGIDGVLDGTAYRVMDTGRVLAGIQTGRLQEYLALATVIILVVFASFWFL